jgi:hypothetical protein
MSERQGFWSARPRPGHDDAALLAVEHLHALRQLTRHELRERADGDWRDEEVAGRYEFPTRWYPLAMRIVCVAMIVVFLLKT